MTPDGRQRLLYVSARGDDDIAIRESLLQPLACRREIVADDREHFGSSARLIREGGEHSAVAFIDLSG